MEGWNSYFFGANTPRRSLLEAIDLYKPDIVAISATMTFHLSEVGDMINSIRATKNNNELKLMVGGYPFEIADGLWERIGADAYARNAADATERALELVN
ncbi:MAG: cobalamin-dependent protein [Melioribacteraceae bacterium]|nr:cobalamin-dependent protein [Melioribacteraceae bacterium]